MISTRQPTITEKVPTQFGSLYVHVNFDGLQEAGGRAIAVRFSSPGKFADTTMGEVLDKLSEAITDILGQK